MADVKAKRSSVLQNLKKDLANGFLDKTVDVNGHKFKLRTLNEDDELWADVYTRTSTPVSLVTSRRAPRLAVAIVEIDGVGTSSLFDYPDDMKDEAKKDLNENPIRKKYWVYEQMLYFLLEEGNRPFINDLWEHFQKLEEERAEAIKKLPN